MRLRVRITLIIECDDERKDFSRQMTIERGKEKGISDKICDMHFYLILKKTIEMTHAEIMKTSIFDYFLHSQRDAMINYSTDLS